VTYTSTRLSSASPADVSSPAVCMGSGYRRGAHRVRAGGATSPTNTARSASFACEGTEQGKLWRLSA
jgi:hypothetical protein